MTISLTANQVKEIQQGLYSQLFWVSKSSPILEETVCISIGMLITVTSLILSQTFRDCFVSYYRFSERYINSVQWAIENSAKLYETIVTEGIFFFYDEETKKVTKKTFEEVAKICGSEFTRHLRVHKVVSSITVGYPSRYENFNLNPGSKFIFMRKGDDLSQYFTRPIEIGDTLKCFVFPNLYPHLPAHLNTFFKNALSSQNGMSLSRYLSQPANINNHTIHDKWEEDFPPDSCSSSGLMKEETQRGLNNSYSKNGGDCVATSSYRQDSNADNEVDTDLRLGPPGSL